MAKQISFGSVFVGTTAAASREPAVERSDSPFRILVLANFGGHGQSADGRGSAEKRPRQPVAVDRDNLDAVLHRFRPSLSLSGVHPNGSNVEITFEELDDFHPDRLFDRLDLFEMLRNTRRRLQNPATFAAAAEEMWKVGAAGPQVGGQESGVNEATPAATDGTDDEAQKESTSKVSRPPPISGGDLLEQLLEQSDEPGGRAEQSRQMSEFQRLIAKVVEPHRLAPDDPRKAEFTDLVDALTADRMRAILHHPEFQALEAAWRGIYFLIRRIETDANLRIDLLDCSKEALAGDLEAVETLRDAALYKLLVERPAGIPGWTLVVGDYQFSATRADVEMLARIAQIVARTGAPFLAGASSAIFGCPSVAATPDPDDWRQPDETAAAMWQQLRQLPQATSLGLAAPRFLLRLPYGRESSPLERFEFEEIPAASHEAYLWGNSALACACLVAQTFSETGANMGGRLYRDLDDLPVHLVDDEGESHVKPCAEALLLDRAVERILEFGIIPLQSFGDRGAVRLVRLQSLADPPAALAGLG